MEASLLTRSVLTDQTVEISSSDDDDYYDEEENPPVFKRATVGMSPLELTRIIVGGDFNPKYLCKVKPVSVQHNAAFIVDLKHVELRYLGADDNGAWEIS